MLYFFDVETFLIQPGLTTPRLVCLTYENEDGTERGILKADDAVDWYFARLANCDTLYAANAKFDNRVMAQAGFERGIDDAIGHVFKAYSESRLGCVQLREKLGVLGTLGYIPKDVSVAKLTQRYANKTLQGKGGVDAWRFRYNELEAVPLEEWPQSAVDYAMFDATAARLIYEGQNVNFMTDEYGSIPDEFPQAAYDFALSLMEQWGLYIDEERVTKLHNDWCAEKAEWEQKVRRYGIMRADGRIDQKMVRSLVSMAYNGNPPRTPKGNIQTSKEVIQDAPNPDDRLQALIKHNAIAKNISTYSSPLMEGCARTGTIHPRYNVLVKTGRTSSSQINIQNQNQNSGIRECFIPRDGCVFVFADWNGQEDRSLTQIMHYLGLDSTGVKRYQDDPQYDPHSDVGWRLLRERTGSSVEYEGFRAIYNARGSQEALQAVLESLPEGALGDMTDPKEIGDTVKWARSMAKIIVFGGPGGMVAKTLVTYAKGWGLEITEDFAQLLLDLWQESDPARGRYLQNRKHQTGWERRANWTHPDSGRTRAKCGYTEFCNTPFQGQTADGAKYSLFLFSWSCYAANGPYSDLLYNKARPIAFIHDEIGAEALEDSCQEVALGLGKCMDEGMNLFHPDVPCVHEVDIMRRWSKKASSRRLPDGTLSIWEEGK